MNVIHSQVLSKNLLAQNQLQASDILKSNSMKPSQCENLAINNFKKKKQMKKSYKSKLNQKRLHYHQNTKEFQNLEQIIFRLRQLSDSELVKCKQNLILDCMQQFINQTQTQCHQKASLLTTIWNAIINLCQQIMRRLCIQSNQTEFLHLNQSIMVHKSYQQMFQKHRMQLDELKQENKNQKKLIDSLIQHLRERKKQIKMYEGGLFNYNEQINEIANKYTFLKTEHTDLLINGHSGQMTHQEANTIIGEVQILNNQQACKLFKIPEIDKKNKIRKQKRNHTQHHIRKINDLNQIVQILDGQLNDHSNIQIQPQLIQTNEKNSNFLDVKIQTSCLNDYENVEDRSSTCDYFSKMEYHIIKNKFVQTNQNQTKNFFSEGTQCKIKDIQENTINQFSRNKQLQFKHRAIDEHLWLENVLKCKKQPKNFQKYEEQQKFKKTKSLKRVQKDQIVENLEKIKKEKNLKIKKNNRIEYRNIKTQESKTRVLLRRPSKTLIRNTLDKQLISDKNKIKQIRKKYNQEILKTTFYNKSDKKVSFFYKMIENKSFQKNNTNFNINIYNINQTIFEQMNYQIKQKKTKNCKLNENSQQSRELLQLLKKIIIEANQMHNVGIYAIDFLSLLNQNISHKTNKSVKQKTLLKYLMMMKSLSNNNYFIRNILQLCALNKEEVSQQSFQQVALNKFICASEVHLYLKMMNCFNCNQDIFDYFNAYTTVEKIQNNLDIIFNDYPEAIIKRDIVQMIEDNLNNIDCESAKLNIHKCVNLILRTILQRKKDLFISYKGIYNLFIENGKVIAKKIVNQLINFMNPSLIQYYSMMKHLMTRYQTQITCQDLCSFAVMSGIPQLHMIFHHHNQKNFNPQKKIHEGIIRSYLQLNKQIEDKNILLCSGKQMNHLLSEIILQENTLNILQSLITPQLQILYLCAGQLLS